MSFKCSLEYRIRMSENQRRRYASDPMVRLRVVNAARQRAGREPYASVDEIPDYSQVAKDAAQRRQRDGSGRFV